MTEVLADAARAVEAPVDDFIRYAAEDTIGGYHSDPSQCKYPVGSLWGIDGQILYALCRWLKPDHVVEIGTHRGASAVHILSALAKNDHGRLTTIDVVESTGDLIPPNLMGRCDRIFGRGQDLIPGLAKADLVFEDASHGADDVFEILGAAAKHLAPKIVVSHDATHFLAGADIQEGWRRAFGDDFTAMATPPGDCGMAFRRMR